MRSYQSLQTESLEVPALHRLAQVGAQVVLKEWQHRVEAGQPITAAMMIALQDMATLGWVSGAIEAQE